EMLTLPVERVTFKAPETMSGPNVHRLKMDVMESFNDEPQEIIIDFTDVDYVDMHGLIILKDICELIKTSGTQGFACNLNPDMHELLTEIDLLAATG
ncbi:MAG: STAS domain-containing protein, partial [Gemmatimonadota bacterium]|nr:STAS domain-containing protein [Gemmatimonadota bacterium]